MALDGMALDGKVVQPADQGGGLQVRANGAKHGRGWGIVRIRARSGYIHLGFRKDKTACYRWHVSNRVVIVVNEIGLGLCDQCWGGATCGVVN